MDTLYIDTLFGYSIDLSFWQDLITMSVAQQVMAFFAVVVWWLLIIILFTNAANKWMQHKQKEFIDTWEWTVLAVDVPPEFVQSPKAMEQIFVHLSGAHIEYNIYERYFLGKVQKWFSFETISIEGYIQFLIHTEVEFRDLVEAAVYAQYFEAEITEVEDYVTSIPDIYPNEEYNIQGINFSLAEKEIFPIRTYPNFEYNLTKDVVFADPMAAILENFTRIGAGEHLWLQLVIIPSGNSWKKDGIKTVKDIIANKKDVKKKGIVGHLGSMPESMIKMTGQAWRNDFSNELVVKKEEVAGKIADLTPGNKSVIESIEDKISKIGFKTKMRAVYSAKKDFFKPNKCISGLIGSMNQFHINNKNGFKAKIITGTSAMSAYKTRKIDNEPYILNIEELATVWHFPLPYVKTPLLQKAGIKRSEPPINLPIENFELPVKSRAIADIKDEIQEEDNSKPDILPYA